MSLVTMSEPEEDEFGDAGWVDDYDLMLAASRVEGAASRSTKRRRLNSGGTDIIPAHKDNSMHNNTLNGMKG